MSSTGSGLRKKSRVITGFHRLGIVLAVPVLLGALGTAVSAWFSNDGPYVPDPKVVVPAPITLKSQASNVRDMTDDELRLAHAHQIVLETKAKSVAQIEVDTGPHRTFAVWVAPLAQLEAALLNADAAGDVNAARTLAAEIIKQRAKQQARSFNDVLTTIALFEKRRGVVLLAKEQPVLTGDILVQEDEAARKYSFSSWNHLARGFDWQRIAIAGGIAAFAAFLYIVTRALGWVIDGFVSRTAE